MTAIAHRFLPLLKKRFSEFTSSSKQWDWENITLVMDAYWLRLIILSCLSPVFMIVPAIAFKLSSESFSMLGYILSTTLLIPWLLIPALFIQHITSRSKMGKNLSFAFIGILLMIFILWITIINF